MRWVTVTSEESRGGDILDLLGRDALKGWFSMVGRVEWGRYAGDDIEAVVAMMINREHPNSVRITPSRGDGGVDILDRGAASDGGDVVYQVKKHAKSLTAGQKSKVAQSVEKLFDREKGDPRWKDLNVTVWRLVTPWDPTSEAEAWLQGLVGPYGVKVVWDGLTYVEQLAARYTDVIDYYLFDGKSAVIDAYRDAITLMSLSTAGEGDMTVTEVSGRIETALHILDHDPHYLYEIRFGHGGPPEPPHRVGLVLTEFRIDPAASTWRAVDVIARCAASTEERPITVQGVLHLEPGSEAEESFRNSVTYGTHFTSPEGAYHGAIDAPGGVGGPLEGASIYMSSLPDIGDNPELHLEVLDPNGEIRGSVNVNRIERTRGNGGLRVVLEEENKVFTLEDRYNLDDLSGERTLRFGEIVGLPVGAVAPALTFLSHCHAPNVGRLSVRHTPAAMGVVDANLGLFDDEEGAHRSRVAELINMLVTFQERASTVITVPDLANVAPEQIQQWKFAIALLRGQESIGTYPDGGAVFVELAGGVEVDGGDVLIEMPLTVMVGSQTIGLGKMHADLEGAHLVERRESDGRTFHVFQTPDRRVRYRFAPSNG